MKQAEQFQLYQLEAYLGDYASDYDIAAIISEATEVDYDSGNRYWLEDIDLAEICERHEVRSDD